MQSYRAFLETATAVKARCFAVQSYQAFHETATAAKVHFWFGTMNVIDAVQSYHTLLETIIAA